MVVPNSSYKQDGYQSLSVSTKNIEITVRWIVVEETHSWLFGLLGDQLIDAAVHRPVAARLCRPAPEHVRAGGVFGFPSTHAQAAHAHLPGRHGSVRGRAPPFLFFRSQGSLFSFVKDVAVFHFFFV